jgi:hypothetical protein
MRSKSSLTRWRPRSRIAPNLWKAARAVANLVPWKNCTRDDREPQHLESQDCRRSCQPYVDRAHSSIERSLSGACDVVRIVHCRGSIPPTTAASPPRSAALPRPDQWARKFVLQVLGRPRRSRQFLRLVLPQSNPGVNETAYVAAKSTPTSNTAPPELSQKRHRSFREPVIPKQLPR